MIIHFFLFSSSIRWFDLLILTACQNVHVYLMPKSKTAKSYMR